MNSSSKTNLSRKLSTTNTAQPLSTSCGPNERILDDVTEPENSSPADCAQNRRNAATSLGLKKFRTQPSTRKSNKIESEDVSVPSNFEHLAHVEKDSNENNFILPKAQNDRSVRNIFLMINQNVDKAIRFPESTKPINLPDNPTEDYINVSSSPPAEKLNVLNTSKTNGNVPNSSEYMVPAAIQRPFLKPEEISMCADTHFNEYSYLAEEPDELPLPRKKYLSYIQNPASNIAYSPITPLGDQYHDGANNFKCEAYDDICSVNNDSSEVFHDMSTAPAAEDLEKVFRDFDELLNEQYDMLPLSTSSKLLSNDEQQPENSAEKKSVKALAKLLHKSISDSTRRQQELSADAEISKNDSASNEGVLECNNDSKKLKLVNIYGIGERKTIAEIIASKKRTVTEKPSPPPAVTKPKLRPVDIDNFNYNNEQNSDADAKLNYAEANNGCNVSDAAKRISLKVAACKSLPSAKQSSDNEHKDTYFKSLEYSETMKNGTTISCQSDVPVGSSTAVVTSTQNEPEVIGLSNEKRKKDSGYNSPTNDMQFKGMEKTVNDYADEHIYYNLPCCDVATAYAPTKRFLDTANIGKAGLKTKDEETKSFREHDTKNKATYSADIDGDEYQPTVDVVTSKISPMKQCCSADVQSIQPMIHETADNYKTVKWRAFMDTGEILYVEPTRSKAEDNVTGGQNATESTFQSLLQAEQLKSTCSSDATAKVEQNKFKLLTTDTNKPTMLSKDAKKKPIPKPRSRQLQSTSSTAVSAKVNDYIRFRDVRSRSATPLERISERNEVTSFAPKSPKTVPAPPAPPPRPSLKNSNT